MIFYYDDLELYEHKDLVTEIYICNQTIDNLPILSRYTNLICLYCVNNQLKSSNGLKTCI